MFIQFVRCIIYKLYVYTLVNKVQVILVLPTDNFLEDWILNLDFCNIQSKLLANLGARTQDNTFQKFTIVKKSVKQHGTKNSTKHDVLST